MLEYADLTHITDRSYHGQQTEGRERDQTAVEVLEVGVAGTGSAGGGGGCAGGSRGVDG